MNVRGELGKMHISAYLEKVDMSMKRPARLVHRVPRDLQLYAETRAERVRLAVTSYGQALSKRSTWLSDGSLHKKSTTTLLPLIVHKGTLRELIPVAPCSNIWKRTS